MDTYFASPEMTDDKELSHEIGIVSNDPVMTGLLHSISGILAILDENRQILAVNDSFLKLVGIDDQREILGLRPGRVLQCVYSDDGPSGCGTTKYCSTCGAAIAIVSSLGQNISEQRICALSANRDGKIIDIALLVKSHPIMIGSKRFILLFLQDITNQQQRAALERTFFHDTNNLLTILMGTSELIVDEGNFISFYVHNSQEIPQKIANRIFQRNFSTKEQDGRGTGTFSMKLFGEKFLGGKVDFSTSKADGTIFKFSYPV
ncbi:MAG: hypothetical protein GX654_17355 [Desulfatiglans sp.]|mgnify:CR=1 FL=1|jgi:hypothetical protein|nr:hypothetical protein [Desulfatiglans sp.]